MAPCWQMANLPGELFFRDLKAVHGFRILFLVSSFVQLPEAATRGTVDSTASRCSVIGIVNEWAQSPLAAATWMWLSLFEAFSWRRVLLPSSGKCACNLASSPERMESGLSGEWLNKGTSQSYSLWHWPVRSGIKIWKKKTCVSRGTFSHEMNSEGDVPVLNVRRCNLFPFGWCWISNQRCRGSVKLQKPSSSNLPFALLMIKRASWHAASFCEITNGRWMYGLT